MNKLNKCRDLQRWNEFRLCGDSANNPYYVFLNSKKPNLFGARKNKAKKTKRSMKEYLESLSDIFDPES